MDSVKKLKLGVINSSLGFKKCKSRGVDFSGTKVQQLYLILVLEFILKGATYSGTCFNKCSYYSAQN